MHELTDPLHRSLLDASTPIGAAVWAVLLLVLASIVARIIRRTVQRLATHLSDTTGLRFTSALAQALTYLGAFILYARLVPELHALGTALLASVSVVSIVLGFAAQSTLSNLFAGFSLVLYRPFRIGDEIEMVGPKGLTRATVERVFLGYTILRDSDGDEVIVPNSVMATSVVIRIERKGTA